ncbi:DUF5085 family protein [Staphylococcus xylosus]|uniref:DUF5085 family protein n=1 Tax=Staphylococcus xylosus TaxID=1288 RepID=UPI001CDBC4BA|nr:DUF5085 family protein [Staphylococcus xylosus]MCM3518693.1 DUF5085 family protein [Staphylococcus xylosus]MCQ3817423.1 DUF5085 family protein [Staphylococcus xylosus]MCQ3820126.1 DUF5085 family protein [Staphylococcus xylosus]UBV37550.1 DUF5085 family protein [Staphylococcus xylosus]
MNKTSYSSIRLKNVAYKQFLDATTQDYETIFNQFLKLCENIGVSSVGPINFAVTQIDLQKRFNIEVFMQVDKAFRPTKELNFRTYFCIDMLLQGRITSNDFVNDEIALLEDMNRFAKENNLSFVSPYYHTFKTDRKSEKGWIDIKVKVMEL